MIKHLGRVLTVVVALNLPVSAAESVFRSAPGGTSLLELYSSEGCSSCPPADAWVGSLRREPGLWRDFVPVAFQVDYWDYLGWRDILATPENSARQQSYGRLVTPQLLLNGRSFGGIGAAIRKPKSDAGTLEIRSDGIASQRVVFKPSGADAGGLVAHAALLGFGVASTVTRGENSGSVLRHEFVVLDHAARPLDDGRAAFSLRPNPAVRAGRLGVAAWVSRGDDPTPLQAAGGYLGAE
ncbi:MAG: DUF1223 domain-containing protein [Elusimicrobia bacterium]|nr:DUF1223 domain-containing protein [Elusimicrobiota bacterium]